MALQGQARKPELAGADGEADGAATKDAATNPNDQWQLCIGTKIFKNLTQILLQLLQFGVSESEASGNQSSAQ